MIAFGAWLVWTPVVNTGVIKFSCEFFCEVKFSLFGVPTKNSTFKVHFTSKFPAFYKNLENIPKYGTTPPPPSPWNSGRILVFPKPSRVHKACHAPVPMTESNETQKPPTHVHTHNISLPFQKRLMNSEWTCTHAQAHSWGDHLAYLTNSSYWTNPLPPWPHLACILGRFSGLTHTWERRRKKKRKRSNVGELNTPKLGLMPVDKLWVNTSMFVEAHPQIHAHTYTAGTVRKSPGSECREATEARKVYSTLIHGLLTTCSHGC